MIRYGEMDREKVQEGPVGEDDVEMLKPLRDQIKWWQLDEVRHRMHREVSTRANFQLLDLRLRFDMWGPARVTLRRTCRD